MPADRHCYNCMNLKLKMGKATHYSSQKDRPFYSARCFEGKIKTPGGTERSLNLYTVRIWGEKEAKGCKKFDRWADQQGAIDEDEWGWLPDEKYGGW